MESKQKVNIVVKIITFNYPQVRPAIFNNFGCYNFADFDNMFYYMWFEIVEHSCMQNLHTTDF